LQILSDGLGYDKTDNLKTVTDPRSNVFSYGFDPLNRLISETDEENKTVNLTRNGVDAITAYTDARNLSTSYIRNGFGEVIREVSPDRGTITYWRDARGLSSEILISGSFMRIGTARDRSRAVCFIGLQRF